MGGGEAGEQAGSRHHPGPPAVTLTDDQPRSPAPSRRGTCVVRGRAPSRRRQAAPAQSSHPGVEADVGGTARFNETKLLAA